MVNMNSGEIILNILICLITGMVSGIITGVIVTNHYRKKDDDRNKKNMREKNLSIVIEYFEDIMSELEILEREPMPDYTHLKRLLKKREIRYTELKSLSGDTDSPEYSEIVSNLINLERKCNSSEISIQEMKNIIGKINLIILERYLVSDSAPCKGLHWSTGCQTQ